MKYAVIAISGSQYKVEEGQQVTVDSLNLKEADTTTTDKVLLAVDGDKVQVGFPYVENASVEYQVLKNYQGRKLRVFKYKAKSRYQKTRGFRAQLTDIKILKISD